MSNPATTKQKDFLRQLGHKDVSSLTVGEASQLIDKLLTDEKASGKTFPCPYCKARFSPRPKHQKKCPSCGQTIIHKAGRFLTQQKFDEQQQKEWLKETRRDVRESVRDDWREEKKIRREFGEAHYAGFVVKAGPNCPHAKHLENLLVLIEDANDTPELLPPYDECREESCECEYEPVTPAEVKKLKLRIAEWGDSKAQAKLKTRHESPQSSLVKAKSSGCLVMVVFAVTAFSLFATL